MYSFRSYFFFFNDTATTEIYTLSLHDALPISPLQQDRAQREAARSSDALRQTRLRRARRNRIRVVGAERVAKVRSDRKSTRLNSSHANISYAVFCLKKKKKNNLTYSTM